MITMNSTVSPGHQVTVDGYSRNEPADEYRQVNADTYAVASQKAGPPPKAFQGGHADLPAFTASGVDPQLLLQLPYRCRHYTAADGDAATVHGIFEQYAHDEHATLDHQGLTDAIGRIRDWASGRIDRPTADVPSLGL